MKPKSFSASALHVFEQCPARYKAENVDRSRGFGGTAATLGTTVHGALEMFVKATIIEKSQEPTLEFLQDCFKMSYVTTFGTTNYETIEFMEGAEMLVNWFARNFKERQYFETATVISCEIKSFFDVPTSLGPIPFNYIWDRFDYMGDGKYKVVDYKSNRWGIQPADLVKKVQARAYGLAAAIQLKNEGREYSSIWVEFDMLRHKGPVGIKITHQDNVAFWNYLKAQTEEILKTPDDEAEERLNPECLFCVRKTDCEALRKNIMVGGLHSIGSIEQAIDLRAQIEWQRKGLNSLLEEIDKKILTEAKQRDMHEFESEDNKLIIGIGQRRNIDADMVEKAIGENLFSKYGGKSITLGNVDKLLKGKELTDQQKRDLRGLIYYTAGNPSVRIEPKNPIDEE